MISENELRKKAVGSGTCEKAAESSAYNEVTISDQIHTKWAGKTVHFARETDSTNLWIKRLAKEGAPQGTLALAEFQSAGRGRLGRSWEVPEGTSVMMSILLRPEFEPRYAPTLTLVMGMAVAKAVKTLGLDVSIKWPNDVVVSRKKICGILTEMGVRDGKIDYAVIGVGINVNIREFPEEMADKATSLYLESGREFDRSQIPGLVMEAFEEYYEKFAATCDLSGLKKEYESILANYNQPVRVLAKEPYEGIARGITDGGELLVEKQDGTIEAVSAGEVSVRGLYSYV
ncbi:biotin--[acetyl-CoA-carboxylase] ligase [Blautia sp. HCP3S3_H10_1]|uniref:biotin--[acetyl-CoA-carboxylase] ligase n=1 Tax=unclassified Blautia TaxID=2648079 RepID=UPI003F914B58|nr:biotin--[acetyl-CoA-carboxylase] ligase [Clostridia bacterium]